LINVYKTLKVRFKLKGCTAISGPAMYLYIRNPKSVSRRFHWFSQI